VLTFLSGSLGPKKIAIRNPSLSSAVSFYDLETITCFEKITARFAISALKSLDDNLLLVDEQLGGILMDPKSKEKVAEFNFAIGSPTAQLTDLQYNSDSKTMTVILDSGQLLAYDLRNPAEPKDKIVQYGPIVSSLAFMDLSYKKLQQMLALGYDDGLVRLVDSRNVNLDSVSMLLKHANSNAITSITSQDDLLLTGDQKGLLSLWLMR
jgi:WD40 repeat protein